MILYYIIFIKYFMYLCDFPSVFQGGKLSYFPNVNQSHLQIHAQTSIKNLLILLLMINLLQTQFKNQNNCLYVSVVGKLDTMPAGASHPSKTSHSFLVE